MCQWLKETHLWSLWTSYHTFHFDPSGPSPLALTKDGYHSPRRSYHQLSSSWLQLQAMLHPVHEHITRPDKILYYICRPIISTYSRPWCLYKRKEWAKTTNIPHSGWYLGYDQDEHRLSPYSTNKYVHL